jgi:hypothetical protein
MTAVIGLITDDEETIGRRSYTWQCGARTTTSSSMSKMLISDYRKQRAEHAPIHRAAVEQVESLKFLGVHITKK